MDNRLLLSRRSFLRASALCGAGLSVQAFMPRMAFAAENARLLIVNLNGGLDWLSALQPMGSDGVYDALKTLRPTLALNPAALLAANQSFGFHPKLTRLKSMYDDGSLTTILNVGCRNMSRSHLEAEVALTRGSADLKSGSTSGLVNRIGSISGWSSLKAIGVTGDDPIFAGGEFRAVQARSLEDLYFRAFDGNYHAVDHLVGSLYDVASGDLLDPGNQSRKDYVTNLQTLVNNTDAVQDGVKGTQFPTSYPQTQFGKALKSAEIAFASPQINSQLVYMRTVGFDTHSKQAETLDRLLGEFNAATATFVDNMKARGLWSSLIVLVISEFGRTNVENASGGTDHGGANAVCAFGGRVKGGSIIGSLNQTALRDNGWLQPQFNYTELYRRALIPLGLDVEKIIPSVEGPSLAGLFS